MVVNLTCLLVSLLFFEETVMGQELNELHLVLYLSLAHGWESDQDLTKEIEQTTQDNVFVAR